MANELWVFVKLLNYQRVSVESSACRTGAQIQQQQKKYTNTGLSFLFSGLKGFQNSHLLDLVFNSDLLRFDGAALLFP